MKWFLFNIRPEALAGVRRSLPGVFHLKVAVGFNGDLSEEEGVTNVASVYEKLERLKRLAGFLW